MPKFTILTHVDSLTEQTITADTADEALRILETHGDTLSDEEFNRQVLENAQLGESWVKGE